ncbi:MAG: flagellar hook-length control protein FliK [Pseudomonadota bacterium]
MDLAGPPKPSPQPAAASAATRAGGATASTGAPATALLKAQAPGTGAVDETVEGSPTPPRLSDAALDEAGEGAVDAFLLAITALDPGPPRPPAEGANGQSAPRPLDGWPAAAPGGGALGPVADTDVLGTLTAALDASAKRAASNTEAIQAPTALSAAAGAQATLNTAQSAAVPPALAGTARAPAGPGATGSLAGAATAQASLTRQSGEGVFAVQANGAAPEVPSPSQTTAPVIGSPATGTLAQPREGAPVQPQRYDVSAAPLPTPGALDIGPVEADSPLTNGPRDTQATGLRVRTDPPLQDTALRTTADLAAAERAQTAVSTGATPTAPTTSPSTAPGLSETARALAPQIATALQAHPGSGRIRVELDPPELGRIEIGLDIADQGLRATLVADKSATSDLLRRHSEMLLQQLQDAGFAEIDLQFGTREGPTEHRFEGPGDLRPEEIETIEPAKQPDKPLALSTEGIDMRL